MHLILSQPRSNAASERSFFVPQEFNARTSYKFSAHAVVKVRTRASGLSPLLKFEPTPCNSMSTLFESVILCPNNAKLVGYGMGVGFAPTWLRQLGEPSCASHDHFNHWIYHHNIHPSQDTALCRLKTYHRSSMTQNVLQKKCSCTSTRPIASTVDHKKTLC